MSRQRIEPQSGVAFFLRRGETLLVVDPLGEQVADLIAFSANDPLEWMSTGRTIDYNGTIYITTGHRLYSNRSRVMLSLVADTVGRHDLLYTPCSAEMFQLLYHEGDGHPSCFGNLCQALASHDIPPDRIPTTFNVFMNVDVAPSGELTIRPPKSKAGDLIELRAEMDLLVGLTACSAELSNNYRFKPIDFEIRPA